MVNQHMENSICFLQIIFESFPKQNKIVKNFLGSRVAMARTVLIASRASMGLNSPKGIRGYKDPNWLKGLFSLKVIMGHTFALSDVWFYLDDGYYSLHCLTWSIHLSAKKIYLHFSLKQDLKVF